MKKFKINNKDLYVCYQNSDLDNSYKEKFFDGKFLNYEDILNLKRLGIVITEGKKTTEQVDNMIGNTIAVLPTHFNNKEKEYISEKYNIPITKL